MSEKWTTDDAITALDKAKAMTDRQFEPGLGEAAYKRFTFHSMEPSPWSQLPTGAQQQWEAVADAVVTAAAALWQEKHGEPSKQWARDLYDIILRDYEAIPTSGEVVTADIRAAFTGLCDYLETGEPSPAYVAGLEKALKPFAEAWQVATNHPDVVRSLSLAQLNAIAKHEIRGNDFKNAAEAISKPRETI